MEIQLINVAHAGVISDAVPLSAVGMNILNFLLSITGIIAIIALAISGIMYFTSFGNEQGIQQAKKYAQYSVIGIIIVMGGMVAINTIGQFFK